MSPTMRLKMSPPRYLASLAGADAELERPVPPDEGARSGVALVVGREVHRHRVVDDDLGDDDEVLERLSA